MAGIGDAAAYQQQIAAQQKKQKAADQQWQKVQAANAGGKTGADGFTTDFEGAGGLVNLQNMIKDADPDAISHVATQWTTIGNALGESATDLGTHVNNLLQNWTGASADAFRENATTLNTSLNNGAQYAHQTSSAMTDASIALSAAQSEMPGMPSRWDRFSRAVTSEDGDIQFKQDAASKGLDYAVQHDGSQLSAVEQAHQKAVLVMEKVGVQYNSATAKLSETPPPHVGGTGVWPAPPSGSPGSPVSQPKGTVPESPGQVGPGGNGDDGTGNVKAIAGVTPESPQKLTPVDDPSGVNGGIDGGTTSTVVPPSSSTLDGAQGGPTTGTGTGTVGTGVGGVGGTGGIGSGSGGGTGVGGGAFGAVGGPGIGGGLGGGFGAGGGRLSAGIGGKGLGEGGLAGEGSAAGSVTGEGEGALAGEGAAGAEGKSGTGMGMGMGGAGRGGNNNKKKRKSRAAYLLEDDETWAQDAAPNPPVIG